MLQGWWLRALSISRTPQTPHTKKIALNVNAEGGKLEQEFIASKKPLEMFMSSGRCYPGFCRYVKVWVYFLMLTLQGTSGPDPTTVYVDLKSLRHDRYSKFTITITPLSRFQLFFLCPDHVFFTSRVRLVERGAPQSLLLSESGKVIHVMTRGGDTQRFLHPFRCTCVAVWRKKRWQSVTPFLLLI